jgi:hypothetical protein
MPIPYKPPSTADLARLKDELSMPNSAMADLFGMSAENWRKYTGGGSPRPVSQYMLFFAMARLELSADIIERILARMRRAGAQIDLQPSSSSPAQPGEQEQ